MSLPYSLCTRRHHLLEFNNIYPPASQTSRELANLTERKNPHTTVLWCQRICLSIHLSVCYKIWPELSNLTLILNKKNYQTCTIRRGVWNLPHKFHLHLIYPNIEGFRFFTIRHYGFGARTQLNKNYLYILTEDKSQDHIEGL